MKQKTLFFVVLLVLLVSLPVTVSSAADGSTASYAWDAAPMDWPHWRGPEMNGISRETGLVDRWKPQVKDENGNVVSAGENILWQREDLAGRSTPIVMNGKLYLMARNDPGTDREGEKVVCLNAATGEIIWENKFNVFLSDVPDVRVGWSSVVGDPVTGDVFAMGVCDYFQCLDGETGETKWSHSLSEEYGMLNTYGGRTNFPIIHGNLVIISGIVIGWGEMAKPAHRFIAFDKRNGQPVWYTSTRLFPYDTTYSSPIATVLDGQDAIVFGSGDGGVHAFQPQTGRSIWSYNLSRRGIQISPLVVGNTVVCGHNEENVEGNLMGALVAIDGSKKGDLSKTPELWKHEQWFIGKSTPLHVDGRVYACDYIGSLYVADLKTGQQLQKLRLGGKVFSSPLYADGKIFICTENTVWSTLRPTADGVEIVGGRPRRLNAGSCYGSPIVSHGRIYVPTTSALYCIGQPGQEPTADPRPEPPQAAPKSEETQPAHLQLVPAESLLRPGQRQQFSVRVYNSRGQYLRTANTTEIKYSIDGDGSIDENGKFHTPAQTDRHSAVTLTATIGELSGKARIRVVPDFPWNFDFNDGQIPITWVGARYRHIAVDFDLYQKLKNENPRASELYIYLMTSFINSGQPQATYNNGTPKQVWSAFLRFSGLEFDNEVQGIIRPQTVADAKKEFDPALQMLVDEKVLADFEFTEFEGGGLQLTATRGSRQVDGNGVMCKISTIPLGARSQGWMGHSDLQNYTVQADVLGTAAPLAAPGLPPKMPDIGVQGQRYRLEMRGADQQLKLYSWVAHEIKFTTVPFEWKPDTWYTMKLRASAADGKAVLQGKAWPRGEQEPNDWQIQWTDEPANTHGSPGFFGNAKNAEIFIDNVKLAPNDQES